MAAGNTRFDSEQIGLICAYRFTPSQPGQPLAADALPPLLAAGLPDDSFLWLHLNLSHSACQRWLRHSLPLPEVFFEQLGSMAGSTRLEHVDEVLLAVVNDVTFEFDHSVTDVATLWACATPQVLVTARLKPLRAVDQLRASVKRGQGFASPPALLVHLLQDQADLLIRIARDSTAKVDELEDRLLAQRLGDRRAELAALRRMLVRLQRLLAPEPGSVFRLLNKPPAWLGEQELQDLREATEGFSLVLGDLQSLVERIKLLQEELAAVLNEQTNRTLFTLTLVTVLALPINMVAGFFGMNVGGIPFAANPHGFWLLVALVAGFTLLVGRWAFRWRERF